MPVTLSIEGKSFGSTRPPFPPWSMMLPSELVGLDGSVILRDLLTFIVRAECAAYRGRIEEAATLRIMTPAQIDAALSRGKVVPVSDEKPKSAKDSDAILLALQSFEDRLFYVFVDDIQIDSLDTPFRLSEQPQMLFLRLTALAGG